MHDQINGVFSEGKGYYKNRVSVLRKIFETQGTHIKNK